VLEWTQHRKEYKKETKQKQQQTYETTTTTIKAIAAYKFHSYQMINNYNKKEP